MPCSGFAVIFRTSISHRQARNWSAIQRLMGKSGKSSTPARPQTTNMVVLILSARTLVRQDGESRQVPN